MAVCLGVHDDRVSPECRFGTSGQVLGIGMTQPEGWCSYLCSVALEPRERASNMRPGGGEIDGDRALQ